MVQTKELINENSGNSQVRLCEIIRSSGSCGFNLTKSKWDPYPWVSNVECGSPADLAGLQAGDCLLEVNGEDVLGLRVVEVANRVKARDKIVTVMVWKSGVDPDCNAETLCCGPMPTNLQRLSACMSNIMAALECPVCLDTIPPPANQCANGHLICLKCRVKTEKCPVCRLKLFRGRSLLADQVYNSLIDAFDLKSEEEFKRKKMLKERLFGQKNLSSKTGKPDIKISLLNSPTNKFLTKWLKSGKCSSAENLTETNLMEKNLNALVVEEFHSGLKTKSFSSNEIFKLDSQSLSRSPSVLSNRPGSGLLDINQVSQYCKRPASYHGSNEELHQQIIYDFSIGETITSKNSICPCDPTCKNLVTLSSIFKHIQEHGGPVLHFFKPQIELSLPLMYDKTMILAITAFNTTFIVKILDFLCENETNRLWIWHLNGKQDFSADVTIEGKVFKTTSECPVLAIESFGYQRILNENLGVLLNLKDTCAKLTIKIISKGSK